MLQGKSLERYTLWYDYLKKNAPDSEAFNELASLRDDDKALEDRFYTELSFGTAGLRGVLGAGDNRMNVYTVRKATVGLAAYLCSLPGEKSVAVAYDSRLCSAEFAKETARVLAANGIRVYLYSTLHSVPQLSFTILEKKCIAGVVITASHNPAEYNGYKVYWSHGGQVGPEVADAITACIRTSPDFAEVPGTYEDALKNGTITLIGEETDEIYYSKIETLLSDPETLKKHGGDIRIVYTPLHGSGYVPVNAMMKRIGVTDFYTVPEQAQPDGHFPTVPAPNPEYATSYKLAMKLADEKKADLILCTDPDADRLGCAVRKKDGTFMILTGNQIGALLLYSLLKNRKAAGKLPGNGLVVRSMVSTRLADAIAQDFGADMKEVLTGFRFISEQIDLCEKTGAHTFLFGFEESNGYLAGTFSRDKDSIVASMLLSEAAVMCHLQGKTLYDELMEIYAKFGFYGEGGYSYTLSGKEGIERIQNAMKSLREDVPTAIGGEEIVSTLDFTDTEKTGLPASNVLSYTLASGSCLLVRPSGTEPKLKLYTGCRAGSFEELEQRKAALMAAAQALIGARL